LDEAPVEKPKRGHKKKVVEPTPEPPPPPDPTPEPTPEVTVEPATEVTPDAATDGETTPPETEPVIESEPVKVKKQAAKRAPRKPAVKVTKVQVEEPAYVDDQPQEVEQQPQQVDSNTLSLTFEKYMEQLRLERKQADSDKYKRLLSGNI
jgi:hypothetical protein